MQIHTFLLLELGKQNSKLSTFLQKELLTKEFKFNLEELNNNNKSILAYGKKTEWWLIINGKINVKSEIKESLYNIDYVLPIADSQLAIVAIKRDDKKNKNINHSEKG